MALRGAIDSIKFAKALYLEVNEKELYKGCGLVGEIDAFLAKYKFKRVLTKMTSHGWEMPCMFLNHRFFYWFVKSNEELDIVYFAAVTTSVTAIFTTFMILTISTATGTRRRSMSQHIRWQVTQSKVMVFRHLWKAFKKRK